MALIAISVDFGTPQCRRSLSAVVAGLVPAIHAERRQGASAADNTQMFSISYGRCLNEPAFWLRQSGDSRDKPGHDGHNSIARTLKRRRQQISL